MNDMILSRHATKVHSRSRDLIFIAMRQTVFIIWSFPDLHCDQWENVTCPSNRLWFCSYVKSDYPNSMYCVDRVSMPYDKELKIYFCCLLLVCSARRTMRFCLTDRSKNGKISRILKVIR